MTDLLTRWSGELDDALETAIPQPRRPLDPPPTDGARRLRRVFAAATGGTLLLVLAGVLVTAFAGAEGRTVHVLPLAGWGVAVAACTAGLGLGLTARGRIGGQVPLPAAALVLLALAADTGLSSSVGGIDGPLWVAFVPTILLTAAAVDVASAIAVGVLGGLGVYIASLLAHTAGSASLGRLLVVLPAMPVAAWVSAYLSRSAQQEAARVAESRAALERDVLALSRLLEGVADGDLTRVPALPDGSAPATAIAVAFADTLLALRRLVRQVTAVGERIAGSAADVAHTAAEHAAGVEQQTGAVHETRTTIEELAATAAQNAETAERVAQYAGTTLAHVESGAEAVHDSVDAMERIAHRVDGITERAEGLDDRMARIGTILEVIDEMARQTNLLAFNAAVEAARAGEHGKGFGQVADEVRMLSERARECTAQVRRIVTDVTAQMAATITVSRQGADDVRAGQELTAGVVSALDRITGMATETTAATQQISVATRQQRSAAEAVVEAMARVTTSTGRYEQASTRYVTAAGQLDGLAGELQAAIHRFRVG
jgi:methyl-accepting chemotaxis protein